MCTGVPNTPDVHMDLAALAQSAARSFHNLKVVGSIPPTGAYTGGSNIIV